MLKRLVASVLENYLGEYVNLSNRENVSVGLLQGALELENLPIREDALKKLGFPFIIQGGLIRKARLQVPKQLYWEPWVIVIEGFSAVVVSMKHLDCDKNEEKKIYQTNKKLKLNALEETWKQQQKSETYGSSWVSYITSIVTNIIENLQLHINDVHIRFEDEEVSPFCPFACGITIDSLSAQSTDSNWSPCFVRHDGTDMMHKLVDLQNFSLYFDTNAVLVGKLDLFEIAEHLQSGRSLRNGYENHDYMLSPVIARCYMKRNTSDSPLKSPSTPRIYMDISLPEIGISLSNIQYKYLVHCLKVINRQIKLRECLRWRPNRSVKECAREWWEYLIIAHKYVVHDRLPDTSLQKSIERARNIVDYHNVYYSYLCKNISEEMLEFKNAMEDVLDFELLKTLRFRALDLFKKEETLKLTLESEDLEVSGELPSEKKGLISRLFLGLSGWYYFSTSASGDQTFSEEEGYDRSAEEQIESLAENKLEKEIMDVMPDTVEFDTFLKRDAVFAKLNFLLRKGSLTLLSTSESIEKSLTDGDNSNVVLVAKCSDISMMLETRPKTSSLTFAIKLGGLNLEDKLTKNSCFPHLIGPITKELSFTLGKMNVTSEVSRLSISEETDVSQDLPEKILDLIYEKNPPKHKTSNRVVMKTKSFAVVFNPETLKSLAEFFSNTHLCGRRTEILADAAYSQYEALKTLTKTELKHSMEELLQGEQSKQRIEVNLDIAAPKIIVPENLHDPNTKMVVLDFGHLFFHNISEKEEDKFVTPSQTPPEPEEEGKSGNFLSDDAVHKRLYERYTLKLHNLQVLVGRARDNWKHVHTKGSSSFHFLEKFSIDLLLERRLLCTYDPQYPNIKMSGRLPLLIIHINKEKVQALLTCVQILSDVSAFTNARPSKSRSDVSLLRLTSNVSLSEDVLIHQQQQQQKELEQSGLVLVTADFSVNKLSLEISSRGRPITELQVDQVTASLTKKSHSTSVTMSVHSLLLVDGLQKFGKDFELLAASHRNLTLDSKSGVLHDVPGKIHASQDSLIILEIWLIDANDPLSKANGLGAHFKANFQFNSLDVVANKETIMEIVSFLKDIVPKAVHTPVQENAQSLASQTISGRSTKLTANFYRLSVLLLRIDNSFPLRCAKKIATVTVSSAKIKAVFDDDVLVQGSLGGFHIVDVSPKATKHYNILQVGKKSLFEEQNSPLLERSHAFTFQIELALKKPTVFWTSFVKRQLYGFEEAEKNDCKVSLSMASVCYTHSPKFLKELSECVSEFKDYTMEVASTIRQAASEVAKSLVAKKSDHSNPGTIGSTDSVHGCMSWRSESIASEAVILETDITSAEESDFESRYHIVFNATLETPVVFLPKTPESSDLLMACLGQTSFRNSSSQNLSFQNIKDQITIEVYKMNLYHLNLDEFDIYDIVFSSENFNLAKLFGHAEFKKCMPVLHDTNVEIIVNIPEYKVPYINSELEVSQEDFQINEPASLMNVYFRVTSHFKLVLVKSVYKQILQTLDNLTFQDTELTDISKEINVDIPDFNDILESSISALKPDAALSSHDLAKPPSSFVPENSAQLFWAIQATFEVPLFIVEINVDFGENPKQGLVELKLHEFVMAYEKTEQYMYTCDLSLGSLTMVDLLMSPSSKHYKLMVSSHKKDTNRDAERTSVYSVSCPTNSIVTPDPAMPPSLPSNLCEENVFAFTIPQKRTDLTQTHSRMDRKKKRRQDDDYPLTPPSSPCGPEKNLTADPLVHFYMRMVDKKYQEFESVYKGINRFIDVQFNCLDTTINLQTLVMLLDFFDLGSNVADVYPSKSRSSQRVTVSQAEDEEVTISTEMKLSVESLTLIFNKPEYELAKANISGLQSNLLVKCGTYMVEGQLKSISLLDQSPYGYLFREKFITVGDKALTFDFFVYTIPDLNLKRNFDTKLTLRMATVQYTHTNRFQAEMLAFCLHFLQLQDVVGRIRAVSAGKEVSDAVPRASRILMDIEAESPVILLPNSYKTTNVLVVELGRLKVTNTFLFDGDPKTIRNRQNENLQERQSLFDSIDNFQSYCQMPLNPGSCACLLNVVSVALTDMDLYSAERVLKPDQRTHHQDVSQYKIQKENKGKLLKDKCMLKLQIEQNLDSRRSHSAPDWNICGALSSVHCSLDVDQYKLLRGFLQYNLGEALEEFQTPLIAHLQHPNDLMILNETVWTSIIMSIDLKNFTMELLVSNANKSCTKDSTLAKLDFICSKLLYENKSNGTKDVDLISHEITATDTRYRNFPANERPNVFFNILQQSKECQNTKSLQMELHFHSTASLTSFNVLLNNMRIMCIFDWLLAVQNFLLTNADNPFQDQDKGFSLMLPTSLSSKLNRLPGGHSERELGESSDTALKTESVIDRPHSPLSMSQGIITRRLPVVKQIQVPYKFKMNVRDTQFVVVEDMSTRDTNAVILKITAILKYQPLPSDLPMSCSLQSLEVFSCYLSEEEETALSIIDPMTIHIDLNANPLPDKSTNVSVGLFDAAMVEQQLVLQIHIENTNIRFSYNDIKMFLAIMDSLPQQAQKATDLQKTAVYSAEKVHSKEEAKNFLTDDSDNWLMKNASPMEIRNLTGIELKVSCFSFCLIDDCQDADVPLAEISVNNLIFHQNLLSKMEGKATFKIISDYYNRALSGWEPFIEQLKCQLNWYQERSKNDLLNLKIEAVEVINFNVTSALIHQFFKTYSKWIEDMKVVDRSSNLQQKRLPFVPFVLRNQTGNILWFIKITTNPAIVSKTDKDVRNEDSYIMATDWKRVDPGEEMPFFFQRRKKTRHKETHELRMNQLVVKVVGWEKLDAVSVDNVGVYFRDACIDLNENKSQIGSPCSRARFVFDVKEEGSARKAIVVRSALNVRNKLQETVNIKMITEDKRKIFSLEPNCQVPIPIQFTSSTLWVCPQDHHVDYCDRPLTWTNVKQAGKIVDSCHVCKPTALSVTPYRFCAAVQRENFPESPSYIANLPGHIISLHPPVTLHNLLPIDLEFYFKNTNIAGRIFSTKQIALSQIDLTKDLELGIKIENFHRCIELVIPSQTTNYMVKLRLYDSKKRLLSLSIRIVARKLGAMQLFISAPYWLMNKSGIPLIFKQEGTRSDAAGQSEEHEAARSVMPLLFSFTDKEAPKLCTMRAGKGCMPEENVTPLWCSHFSLENGITHRSLHISSLEANTPHWVFIIGIEVIQGRGRFKDTSIVTFAPRFVINNQSAHSLAIAQRFMTQKDNTESHVGYLTVMSKSTLPFHWPRVDFDQLLCVKINSPGYHWSGGFSIDRNNSFHINIRDDSGNCLLLKVEIALKGPAYIITLCDSDGFPAPFRIDNCSEVPIQYQQTAVTEERLKNIIKPLTSVVYAMDEPTLHPSIMLSVPGGSESNYSMNVLGEGEQLSYQNFIYLSATYTCPRSPGSASTCGPELVLDTHNNYVEFRERENGKRSQLWRMTGSGMLVNEGSSPPRDPRKVSSSVSIGMVLDIADIAPQPGKCVPLILRKPDERRKATQIWKFTENGRLVCANGTLCVQTIEDGLRENSVALLGPGPEIAGEVPPHMQISRIKQRPGSGYLKVGVVMDGPVRVLTIRDIQEELPFTKRLSLTEEQHVASEEKHMNIMLMLSLGGIGISLVNKVPEELLYITLKNITVHYDFMDRTNIVKATVGNIQIDNQLFGAQKEMMMLISSASNELQGQGLILDMSFYRNVLDLNAVIFQHLIIATKKITLQLEERLLLKLCDFLFSGKTPDPSAQTESSYTPQQSLAVSLPLEMRYYFGILKITTKIITLSFMNSSNLSSELKAIKLSTGMHFLAFENATVELDSFIRRHPFETGRFLLNEIKSHYLQELFSQLAKIFGSVDFLGNPLGLVNDVTEGISGLIKEGNVGGLLKNVTHGVTNSAAKVTGTLSDTLGLTMDASHNERREKIKTDHGGHTTAEHVMAGCKGLMFGLYGGLTSVVDQTYEGTKQGGVGGFFSGLGKGLVGTLTKPVAGVLDFATAAATAARESSRRTSKIKSRVRQPRCCHGMGGVLPPYNYQQAAQQRIIHVLNGNQYDEFIIACEQARAIGNIAVHAMITNKQAYFVSMENEQQTVKFQIYLRDIETCQITELQNNVFIKFEKKKYAGFDQPVCIKCQSQSVAQRVIQHILYARELHQADQSTVPPLPPDGDFN